MRTKRILLVLAAMAIAPAVAPLKGGPPPVANPEPGQIPALVKQLGDRDYFVRQRAQDKLGEFGAAAIEALGEAATDPDLEIAARARYLLQQIPLDVADPADPAPVQELLKNYDCLDANGRQQRLRQLAGLPERMGVPALCRLACRERSARFSKLAAIELLGMVKPEAKPEKELVDLLRRWLAGSRRPGATWLLAYVRFAEGPAAYKAWNDLVAAEVALGRQVPGQTAPDLIFALVKFELARVAARREWRELDELTTRFAPQVAAHPLLSYMAAEAKLVQGDKDRAEQFAEQALAAAPPENADGDDTNDPVSFHLQLADMLHEHGQFPWCVREYRQAISRGPADDCRVRQTRLHLAELYYDQEQYRAAADVLQDLLKTLGESTPAGTAVTDDGDNERTVGTTRARMNYFLARHWEQKGDRKKQLQCLEEALRKNPRDVDALIASYRLTGQPPDFHQRIAAMVRATTFLMRNQLDHQPDNANLANQIAWLVGNTEGDRAEALRLARRAVDAEPGNAGFCDTLAQVYFAGGDLPGALEWQKKAAEMAPRSGLIQRQLALLRKAAGKK